ncbi:hypothetical protein PVAND_000196 [Polypedilum vanderplanki]|uniref:Odorant receptor n=1 Tax=Polypedilum vanderplanki TaxID=319348 RepID=A0A9J6BJK5_POLVA|nr:hypothetical protein PVAND_000196 [Polypedilum vanderplanki]
MFAALTPFLIQIINPFRVLILTWYREDLKNVLDYLKNNFETPTDSDEMKINARANQISSIFTGMMWFCSIFTNAGYIIFPIILNIRRYFNNQDFAFILPFKAWFPFEYNYFPLYQIIYILSMHSGNMTISSICAGEGMIIGCCFHLAAQFEIISVKLKKIIDEGKSSKFSQIENDQIYNKLIKVIEIHNEAILKCEILSKILWKHVLIQYISAAFVLCISGLMLIQTDDATIFIYVFFISGFLVSTLNYSLSGNTLINASTKIQETAYNFPWYKCNVKVRKALLMIIFRAQKKVNLKVPFFEVNMETFTMVIRVFWSFYTLAKSFV